MHGVVLWVSPDSSQAVMWAEDNEDLVYYIKNGDSENEIEAGDLVFFEVREEKGTRRASDLKLILGAAGDETRLHLINGLSQNISHKTGKIHQAVNDLRAEFEELRAS